MALRAGQVMVMIATANPVMVRAIGKLNAIHQAGIDQFLHRAVNRRSSQTRIFLSQLLPEIVNREVGSTASKFYETFGNESPWTCVTVAHLVERCINLIC